jgi:NADH-quinone oxidoreductase subunit M
MPLLAATFLILGLACAGFPATLGFVATELLVSDAVETFPLLGFSVVASGAVTGLAILRMYFALFCGKRDSNLHLELKTSERFAFTFAAALLLGLGLVPRPMVRPASTAAAELLRRDTKTRSEAESRNSRTALGQFQPTRAGTFPAQRKPF